MSNETPTPSGGLRDDRKTDAETAALIRAWAERDRRGSEGLFSWPTDGAGYDQHVRFVEHRNQNYLGVTAAAWRRFCLRYADSLTGTGT